jgi:hypothetical protein
MFASQHLTSASYTHPPQGVPAQAGPLGSLPCCPSTSPSALSRAYFYGTVCCQVLLDGWLRPSPDPYGPSETNLPCISSHPVEAGAAGAAGARAKGGTCAAADWGSLSQCDNIGWQCILQSVPSAVCAVVCCIWHGAADGEFSFCSSGIIPQWANEAHPHRRAAGLCCQAGPHTPPW